MFQLHWRFSPAAARKKTPSSFAAKTERNTSLSMLPQARENRCVPEQMKKTVISMLPQADRSQAGTLAGRVRHFHAAAGGSKPWRRASV